MTKAESLRSRALRDAYRLIGECRDLGNEPVLWQTRLLEGLGRLLGLPAGCGGEGLYVGPTKRITVASVVVAEFDPSERDIFVRWASEVSPNNCPIFSAMKQQRARALTRKRTEHGARYGPRMVPLRFLPVQG